MYGRHWELDGAYSSNARIDVSRADERLGVEPGTVDGLRRQGFLWDLWGTDASTIPLRTIREFEGRSWGDLPALIREANRLWDRQIGRTFLQVLNLTDFPGVDQIERLIRDDIGGMEHANSIARVRAYQEMEGGGVQPEFRGIAGLTDVKGGFNGGRLPVKQVVDWIDTHWGPIVIRTLVKAIAERDNPALLPDYTH